MKTKLLKNPIGCIKTQNQAHELVQNIKNICDELSTDGGLWTHNESELQKKLESAQKFFQTAMFVGMLALLDESKKKVEVGGMEES